MLAGVAFVCVLGLLGAALYFKLLQVFKVFFNGHPAYSGKCFSYKLVFFECFNRFFDVRARRRCAPYNVFFFGF